MAATIGQSIWKFLDERFMLSGLISFGRKKKVPEHRRSFWYFFGGICLFLTGIQVATGVMLLLYYTPSIDAAHESVQFIMSEVKFGWLIRSVHSWTANILIGLLFVHMFSTFFLKAYRKPRELTWITGFLLLVLFMAFGFSGYLLPWNELSYFATRVGTDIAGSLPLIGGWLKSVILGGPEVSQAPGRARPDRHPCPPRPDLEHEQARRREGKEGDPLLSRLPL
jgi:cytochrome b6